MSVEINKETEHAAFAAYANQARHNLYLVLNEIVTRAGIEVNAVEENQLSEHPLIKALEPKATPKAQQQLRLIDGLHHAFPFIQPLSRYLLGYVQPTRPADTPSADRPERTMQEDTLLPEGYALLIKDLAKLLHGTRNYLSHAGQTQPQLDDKMTRLMETLYDAALRRIKARHHYNYEDIPHLGRRISNPKHTRRTPQLEASIPNPAFASLSDKQGYFTAQGHALFLCLFLSAKEGQELLSQISGFKDTRYPKYQAKRKVFTCYHLCLPHARLNTSSPIDNQALALDMLSELARCPKALYDHLAPEQQAQYHISAEEQDDLTQQAPEDSEADNILFIRHQERFIPLMLDYLERQGAFKEFAPCVDLGDFYFAAYPKTLYAGEQQERLPVVRRLKKKILCFAHLSSLTSGSHPERWNKPTAWQALEQVNKIEDYPDPYIVQTQPHYHLADDNIALGPVRQSVYPCPERNLDATDGRYTPPKNPTAEFYLSRHELAHLAFYHMLQQKHAPNATNVELLLKQYKSAIHGVFKAIQEQRLKPGTAAELAQQLANYPYGGAKCFNLELRELPEIVQHYLRTPEKAYGPPLLDQAQNTLQLLQTDNQRRLKQAERLSKVAKDDKRTQPGRPQHRLPKAGTMADFLARDILRLQPPYQSTEPRKAGSLLFAELQARLAYYGRDKALLPKLCREMHLIHSDNPHPFLAKVLNQDYPGIIGFYQAYLTQREGYLKGVQTELKDEAHLKQYGWLRKTAAPHGHAAISQHLEHLKQQPVNLARGFFLQPCIRVLQQDTQLSSLHTAIRQADTLNGSHLIQLYYQHVRDDRPPAIYQQPRRYPVLDQAYDDRNGKSIPLKAHYFYTSGPASQSSALDHQKLANWVNTPPNPKQLTQRGKLAGAETDPARIQQARKRASREFYDHERHLRQLRTHDQVLFMATHHLLQNLDAPQELKALRLNDLQRSTLDRQVPYELQLHDKTIYVENIRLKRIGQFRHLLKDRRLPDLLSYYPQPRINYTQLEQELAAYQVCRRQFFQRLLSFEQGVIDTYGLPAANGGKNSSHHSLLQHYFAQQPRPDALKQQAEMLVIRNAFCHNQYPSLNNAYTMKYPEALTLLEQASQHCQQNTHGQLGLAKWLLERANRLYTMETLK